MLGLLNLELENKSVPRELVTKVGKKQRQMGNLSREVEILKTQKKTLWKK